METIYLVITIILFILAISDLIAGVSNDAVNFLNSAVGSKAAPLKVVMLVAAAGVLIGTVFSGGMMEIARSGIFYPEKFSFAHIMIIFLAVMITDIILLDLFNTFGFPTSTTVSLVFELMGASVAIASIYILMHEPGVAITDYINAGKALAVISGILISVVIAFTAGTIIQFITRFLFSFNYQNRLKYLGGIFGGLAITAIVYFILIKGARDAAFMTSGNYEWIKEHSWKIILFCFAGITLAFYFLNLFFKVNILKIVVLAGTFALALSFAGNDLVNFIGVPLAGYESFLIFMRTPGTDPELLRMGSLNDAVKTPLIFLFLSGVVMVITLYKSKKAKTVIYTEVNLSRQDSGEERFGSSALSRGLVKATLSLSDNIKRIIPGWLKNTLEKQFTEVQRSNKDKNQPAFDLLRASVNLVISSALIALGTSMKLPLSTTYVTFMVAMGTSLSDGAWGRESAVYRITGVFSVIGGWFFTAVSAFTVSALLAVLFYFAGLWAIVAMMGVAALTVYRTHRFHLHKEEKKAENTNLAESIDADNLKESISKSLIPILTHVRLFPGIFIEGLENNDPTILKSLKKKNEEMTKIMKSIRRATNQAVKALPEKEFDPAFHFISLQDKIRELLRCISFMAENAQSHVANQHKPLNNIQIDELRFVLDKSVSISNEVITFLTIASKGAMRNNIFGPGDMDMVIQQFRKNEVKRIIDGSSGHRTSLLFMSFMQEGLNLAVYLDDAAKIISLTDHKPEISETR